MTRFGSQHVCLGEVCGIESALVDPREKGFRALLHVGGANIESTTGRLFNLQTAEQEELISGKYLFGERDVLYSKIRPYLRKVALPSFSGLCSADIYPLRPVESRLHREFLFYLLLSLEFTEYANRVSNRAGMPKINREQLFAFRTVLPTPTEQARIVSRIREAMQRVDEVRQLRATVELQADALSTAVFGDAERSLAARRVPLADLLLESRNGRSIKSSGETGNGAVLTLSSVRSPTANLDQRKAILLDDSTAEQFVVRRGDVFISRANTMDLVGLSAMVEHDPPARLIFPDLLIRLRPDDRRISSKYLAYALRFPETRKQIKMRAVGSSQSMVKISGERLREVTVPLPDAATQACLVARLDGLLEVTDDVQNRIRDESARDELLPSTILRKALAGGM